MFIYLVIWCIVAFLAIVGCKNHKYRKICTFCIIMVIALFAGLRYERWSDWGPYYSLFMNAGESSRDVEIGFRGLLYISRHTLGNYNVFLCVIYIIVLCLYLREYRYSADAFAPFCLLVFLSTGILSSGGMRQFIAGCVTYYSIRFIREKKLIPFLITILVAFSIHRSAIVFFPIYWIDKIRIKLKPFLILTVVGVFVGRTGLFQRLINLLMPYIYRIGGVSFSYRAQLYINQSVELNILSLGTIKRFLIMIMLLYVQYTNKSEENNYEDCNVDIYINLYSVGFILALFLPGTFARLGGYFYSAEPVSEALIISNAHNRNNKLIEFLFFSILSLIIWIHTLNTFYPELLIPYRSCLFV